MAAISVAQNVASRGSRVLRSWYVNGEPLANICKSSTPGPPVS